LRKKSIFLPNIRQENCQAKAFTMNSQIEDFTAVMPAKYA
jgi:hypothetical protein